MVAIADMLEVLLTVLFLAVRLGPAVLRVWSLADALNATRQVYIVLTCASACSIMSAALGDGGVYI